MKMKSVFALPVILALAACATPQEPIVAAFNGDSVNIIQPAFTTATPEQLQAKADSICQRGHKKYAERVSARTLPDYGGTDYLFLCLDKPPKA